MKNKIVSLLLLALAVLPTYADSPTGKKLLINKTKDGVAIQGYDAVAYFTDNKPVKGNPKFQATHEGAVYHFASAEHLALFKADPAKYAPAYGGYCGYAASIDRLSPISPEFFQVIEGRLILQHNKRAFDKWNADLPGNLVKANANWPGLVAKNGTGARSLLNLDATGLAIEGYDPVAYFTDGKPVKGNARHEAVYNGARYYFASEAHREIFEKDPAKYAPAYGGYCGYAASIGKVRPISPSLWSIVDGQLILQHSKGAVELWEKNIAGNKAKADKYWPRLVIAKVGVKDPIDSLWGGSVLPDIE
jgi:YHS domain-containing protein